MQSLNFRTITMYVVDYFINFTLSNEYVQQYTSQNTAGISYYNKRTAAARLIIQTYPEKVQNIFYR